VGGFPQFRSFTLVRDRYHVTVARLERLLSWRDSVEDMAMSAAAAGVSLALAAVAAVALNAVVLVVTTDLGLAAAARQTIGLPRLLAQVSLGLIAAALSTLALCVGGDALYRAALRRAGTRCARSLSVADIDLPAALWSLHVTAASVSGPSELALTVARHIVRELRAGNVPLRRLEEFVEDSSAPWMHPLVRAWQEPAAAFAVLVDRVTERSWRLALHLADTRPERRSGENRTQETRATLELLAEYELDEGDEEVMRSLARVWEGPLDGLVQAARVA
jgi:hypothetical protein